MEFWVKDPKTSEKSVSLTLLVISFVAALVANALKLGGVCQDVGSIMELLYSMVALYFGRRFSINGRNFSTEVQTEINKE